MTSNSSLWHTDSLTFQGRRLKAHTDTIVVISVIVAMTAVAWVALQELAPSIFFYYYGLLLLGGLLAIRLGRVEGRLFFLIFSLNVLITLGLYEIYLHRYGTPYMGGGSDDRMFESFMLTHVQRSEWYRYRSIRWWYPVRSFKVYIYLLAWMHWLGDLLGGYHTLMPRFWNNFFLANLAILVYRAGRKHFELSLEAALLAALWLGLSPIIMFITGHIFRDALVALLIFALIYGWNSFGSYNLSIKVVTVVLSVLLVTLLWGIRIQAALLTLMVLAFSLYTTYYHRKWIRVAGILLVGAIAVFFLLNFVGVVHVVSSLSSERILGYFTRYNTHRLTLGESGISQFIFGVPLLISLPLRVVYLMISPLPILSAEIERTFLSVGTLLQILALPFLLIGLVKAVRRPRTWSYVMAFVLFFLSVAFVTFTFRHAFMFYPYFVLVVGLGVDTYRQNHFSLRWIYLGFYFLAILMVMGYVLLKLVLVEASGPSLP